MWNARVPIAIFRTNDTSKRIANTDKYYGASQGYIVPDIQMRTVLIIHKNIKQGALFTAAWGGPLSICMKNVELTSRE